MLALLLPPCVFAEERAYITSDGEVAMRVEERIPSDTLHAWDAYNQAHHTYYDMELLLEGDWQGRRIGSCALAYPNGDGTWELHFGPGSVELDGIPEIVPSYQPCPNPEDVQVTDEQRKRLRWIRYDQSQTRQVGPCVWECRVQTEPE